MIKYGRFKFTGPNSLRTWQPLKVAGVYAILALDKSLNPPFNPIYFGESEDFSERGFLKSHHRFKCWIREAKSLENLFISTHIMPIQEEDERKAIEAELIKEYDPACNRE